MQLFLNANYDFVSKKVRRTAMTISAIIVCIGIVFFFTKGFNLSIDFTGGTIFQYKFPTTITIEELRSEMKSQGLKTVTLQNFGDSSDELLIRVGSEAEAKLVKAYMNQKYPTGLDLRREESVGPSIGSDLRTQAAWAVIFSWLGILLYVAWRFESKFGIGAIIALVHDVLITCTAFVVLGLEFNATVLAAILTLIGYSINDTIVVFDRIREMMHAERPRSDEHFISVINRAINITLSRTIITSLTVLLVVVILYLVGGEVIHNFAFALIVGIITGTYSSVFIATPIMIELRMRVSLKD